MPKNFVVCKIFETPEGIKVKLRDGDKIIYKELPFSNYFFIEQEDWDEVAEAVKGMVEHTEELVDRKNARYLKLYLKNNHWRSKVREQCEGCGVKTYEGDIRADKRFLILHQNIPLEQDKLRILWYDIETYDMYPFKKDKDDKLVIEYPILSIAVREKGSEKMMFWRNKGIDGEEYKEYRKMWKDYVETRDKELFKKLQEQENEILKALEVGEKEVLLQYFEFIKDYDAVSAYNGRRFDDHYVRERCLKHGISSDVHQTINLDYMEVYKKNHYGASLRSYSLENVALFEFSDEVKKEDSRFKNLTEVTKLNWKSVTKAKKIFELFVVYPEVLEEYNIQDCNLLELIEDKLQFFRIHFVITKLAHILIEDTIYNSRVSDMMMLNEYYRRNIVAPTKPSQGDIDERKKSFDFISGGYVGAIRGFYKNVNSFDLKSSYPCHSITYNISPETFLFIREPKLEKVFNEKEIEYIKYCGSASKKYYSKQGSLNFKKYEDDIENKRKELGVSHMEVLSKKFAVDYVNDDLRQECLKEKKVFTPADINYDTNGWHIHPHRVYDGAEFGVLPSIYRNLLEERDKAKAELKKLKYGTPEWEAVNYYSTALKICANAIYGTLALKAFRFYNHHLADSITSCGRNTLKNAIMFLENQGYRVVLHDTDSVYILGVTTNAKDIEIALYKYLKNLYTKYNTIARMVITNPETKNPEENNHYISFNYEKNIISMIITGRKKYYMKYQS